MPDITVDIQTPGDMTIEGTAIPDNYQIDEIIAELVEDLSLPRLSEDGQQITYTLLHVNQNSMMQGGRSLLDAGVQSGDTLRLIPSHEVVDFKPPDLSRLYEPDGNHSADLNMIDVVLSVLDVNKFERVSLQIDRSVEEIIPQIAASYNLPARDDFKQLITYRLASKAKGRYLRPGETLQQAGIPPMDRLTLHREEIAGA
jgi:uncharacterized ubiquitin-like protein YukD